MGVPQHGHIPPEFNSAFICASPFAFSAIAVLFLPFPDEDGGAFRAVARKPLEDAGEGRHHQTVRLFDFENDFPITSCHPQPPVPASAEPPFFQNRVRSIQSSAYRSAD